MPVARTRTRAGSPWRVVLQGSSECTGSASVRAVETAACRSGETWARRARRPSEGGRQTNRPAGRSNRPVLEREPGNPAEVTAISRDQGCSVRPSDCSDLEILSADANRAKLLKLILGTLIIGGDLEL